MTSKRVGAGFYGVLFLIGFATFLVHEAAHWAMGVALGYDMAIGLNGGGPTTSATARDMMLISAAGPVVTLLQAVVAFLLVRTRRSLTAYAALYFAAFMRFMAAVISVFNANDEARISADLGLGTWTLPVLMVLVLVGLTWIASRTLRLSWKTNLLAYVVSTVAVSAIIGLDLTMRG